MATLNYKIEQVNEEWKVFNERIIRMDVEYKIRLYVPDWLNIEYLDEKLPSFENLQYDSTDYFEDGTRECVYKIKISTISKCDTSKDEFSEVTGIYICETRAEIKVLEKTKKIIDSLFKVINKKNNSESLDNLLSERLEKNRFNLERLMGVFDETEEYEGA